MAKEFDPDLYLKSKAPQFDPDKYLAGKQTEAPMEHVGSTKTETGIRSALEGFSLGLSEPVISGGNAIVGSIIDSAMDENVDWSPSLVADEFSEDRERRRQLKADLPTIDAAAQVAGAVAPIAMSGGAFLAGKAGLTGANAALKTAGTSLEAADIGSKVARAGGTAVEKIVSAIPKADAFLKSNSAGRVALEGAKGFGSAVASEGARQAIGRADGFIQEQDETPSLMDAGMFGAKFSAGLKAIPEGISLATKAGKGILSAVSGVSPDLIDSYLANYSKVKDAKSSEEIQSILGTSVEKIRQDAQGQRADFSDNAVDAVAALKAKVVEESEKSYAILDKASKRNASGEMRKNAPKVRAQDIKGAITRTIKDIQGVKGFALGPTQKRTVEVLNELREDFAGANKDLTLSEVKEIIQTLDEQTQTVGRNAGEFGASLENSLRELRSNIDHNIKAKVPEYAEQMLKVSGLTKTLQQVKDFYGDQQKALAQVNRVGTKNGILQTDALDALQAATGKQLRGQVDKIQDLAPIESLTERGVEGLLRSNFGERSASQKALLKQIGSLSDNDFVSMVDSTRVNQAFDSSIREGSKYVNLWTVIGAATLGGVTGSVLGGSTGAVAGAALGSMVRDYGPKTTKAILSKIAEIQGSPTVKKIDEVFAAFPDKVRNDLKTQLIRATQVSDTGTPISIPRENHEQYREDIQDSMILTNIEKARAINQLNRRGSVDPGVMRKVITNEREAKVERPQLDRRPTSPAEMFPNAAKRLQNPTPKELSDIVGTKKTEAY